MKTSFNKKRLFCLVLVCILIVTVGSSSFAKNTPPSSKSEVTVQPEISAEKLIESNFSVRGIDYFYGMDIVTSTEQLNHQLLVKDISIKDDRLTLEATITFANGSSEDISFTGAVYHSEINFYKERGGLVILSDSSTGNWNSVNTTFVLRAGKGDLFSPHANFEGLPALKIALQQKSGENKVILFEGLLPETFNYDLLAANAKTALERSERALYHSREETIIEKEDIYVAENWIGRVLGYGEPTYHDMDSPANNSASSNAATSG